MYILNMSTKLLQHFQLISLVSMGSMKFYLVVEIGNDFCHIHAGRQSPTYVVYWIGFFFFERCYSLITATVCAYKLNKRPMGHIAHLRKQFKSLNKYDYIITLIQRIKKTLYENLLVLHLNKLESPSAKDALYQDWLKLAQWFWRRIF